jgi:hypothetical protein
MQLVSNDIHIKVKSLGNQINFAYSKVTVDKETNTSVF